MATTHTDGNTSNPSSTGLRVFESLSQVYEDSNLAEQKARWISVAKKFEKAFGHAPTFFARSPGRVNIIGEHIDYSGYSVLPLALSTQDVVMAVHSHPGAPATVTVHNSDPEKFPTRKFTLLSRDEGYVEMGGSSADTNDWVNYLKGGFKSMLDVLNPPTLMSLEIFVDGSVPTGAGVSSSAAFICSLCEAITQAYGGVAHPDKGQPFTLHPEDLVPHAIRGEHLAGVSCGGMDQSISLLGRRGCCLTIHFVPKLSAEVVVVPEGAKFVVVNTCVMADKKETAPANYNRRVVEMRAVSALLYKHHNLPLPAAPVQPTVRSFQDLFLATHQLPPFTPTTARTVFAKLRELVDSLLGPTSSFGNRSSSGWTRADIASELGDGWWSRFVGDMTIAGDSFKLYARACHVLSESERVFAFREVCETGGADALKELGRLMDESQASCRDLFECSCDEIDEVCKIGRSLGSLGSRLTGAGWGGCTVHLVPDSEMERFTEGMLREYHSKRFPQKIDVPGWKTEVIFGGRPGEGGGIISLEAVVNV
ncbi:galactokinase [Gonapodya sp. JEL0774]|nr:galactokinase [Gonapodya sp. JEL0774]